MLNMVVFVVVVVFVFVMMQKVIESANRLEVVKKSSVSDRE